MLYNGYTVYKKKLIDFFLSCKLKYKHTTKIKSYVFVFAPQFRIYNKTSFTNILKWSSNINAYPFLFI